MPLPLDSAVNLDQSSRWLSFHPLLRVIESYMTSSNNRNAGQVEGLLRRHRTDFVTLLKNPSRSSLHRETVSSAVKDGISVIENGRRAKKVLPQQVVEEALLLSSMFDINEFTALELIITGQDQVFRFPGMARGPVAVMLYYDAKRNFLQSLKTLLRSSTGRAWNPENQNDSNQDVFRVVSSFLTDLAKEGIVENALNQLNNLDIKKEISMLEKNRAFGPEKFKTKLIDCIQEIRDLYSFVVFAYSAQFGLNDSALKALTDYVAKKIVSPIVPKTENRMETTAGVPQVDCKPTLDYSSTATLMSLLYVLDVSSVFTAQDVDDVSVKSLIVVRNPSFLKDLYQLVVKNDGISHPDVRNIVCLALGITVKSLSSVSETFDDLINGINDDTLVEEAVESRVFDSLNDLLVDNNCHFSLDEFFILRLHHLFVDIPFILSSKVKEMREKGDESGRVLDAYAQQGIQAKVVLPFERFLTVMANFYEKHDTGSLSPDIWSSNASSNIAETSYPIVANNRFAMFNKFVKSILETHCPAVLLVPVLKLLASFAKGCPFAIYSLLKPPSMTHHHHHHHHHVSNHQFSLDAFFRQLHHFVNSNLRGQCSKSLIEDGVLRHLVGATERTPPTTSIEIDIMCAILMLIENIVRNDKSCGQAIVDNQQYTCIATLVGMSSAGIPRNLKAGLLNCLSGFCHDNPSLSFVIYINMEYILPSPQVANQLSYSASPSTKNRQNALCFDMEDVEPRNEEYSVTTGFLNLVKELLPHVSCIRDVSKQVSLEQTVEFIIHSIFLKIESRVFKNEEEKWLVTNKCLEIMHIVLQNYNLTTEEAALNRSGFSVMRDILQENVLFRGIMSIIESIERNLQPLKSEVQSQLSLASSKRTLRHDMSCLRLSLKIIDSVVKKYSDFLQLIRSMTGFPSAALMTPAQLFCNSLREADRLATLVKLTSVNDVIVQTETLNILRSLTRDEPQLSHVILLQCQPLKKHHEDYLLHGFVECIESDDYSLRKGVMLLILDLIESETLSPFNYGLIHKLLGFDRRMQLREAGSFDQTFTCFHSIINKLRSNSCSEERTLALKVILSLTSVNHDIRSTVLRFLRTSYDLLSQYMQHRKDWFRGMIEEEFLTEMSVFLQLLAAEIKTTRDLRTHAVEYMRLLLGQSGQERKFLDLIPDSVYSHVHPEMPEWDFFDKSELWKTIANCSEGTKINTVLLKTRLMSEVKNASLHGHAQNGIFNEVKAILEFAESRNASRERLESKLQYFMAWRDLIETIILCDYLDVLDSEVRGLLLMDLIVCVTQLAMRPALMTALLLPISSLALVTTCKIRTMKPSTHVSATQLVSVGKELTRVFDSSSDIWSHSQRARVNLYASLLHVLRSLPRSSSHEVILSKRLISKLAKDCLDGVELIKMLSLSILNSSHSWLTCLGNDGSLQMLIKSLVNDDRDIKANKCQRNCKAFYAFESKISLLSKLASCHEGCQMLLHLGVIEVLSSLECLDIYSCLLTQNQVCFSIFVSVFRLLVTLKDEEQVSRFLRLKSPLVYAIMTQPEDYRSSQEGQTVLFWVTALLSKLVTFMDGELLKTFMSFIRSLGEVKSVGEAKILVNVLQGCIKFSQQNRECYSLMSRSRSHVAF